MTHLQWIMDYWPWFENISLFKKISDLWTRFSRTFLLATWGHIYMNRLVSTPSSALTNQKSNKFEKRLLSLNIAMSRVRVRTNVYYIQLDQTARFDSLTSLTLVWPLMTLYGLIWPQIISISILGKIRSRNVCILNTFRLIRPVWPKSDLWWPLTDHDIYGFEISKRIPIF